MLKHVLVASTLALSLSVFVQPALAAELSAPSKQEIEHLFSHLEQSGCQFQRNGTWHGSPDAASHLRQKYDYLRKKKLLGSAEDFIERAASQSSMSGKPYEVRCAPAAAVRSADWLGAELKRYRSRQP